MWQKGTLELSQKKKTKTKTEKTHTHIHTQTQKEQHTKNGQTNKNKLFAKMWIFSELEYGGHLVVQ